MHPQHFGGLPYRAATDLVAAAIHDRERVGTEKSRLHAHPRHQRRLRRNQAGQNGQAPPDTSMAKRNQMVHSFMTGRMGRIKLGGSVGDSFPIQAGLPHRSPVLPVLFTLFLQPLFHLGPEERRHTRFGYADDIALLTTGSTLEENVQTLQTTSTAPPPLAKSEGLTFDLQKTEAAYFSRRNDDSNPPLQLDLGNATHEMNLVTRVGYPLPGHMT